MIFETYDIKLIDYATPEATSGNSINSLNNETTLTNTKVEVEKQHVNINNGNLHVKVPVQGLNSMAHLHREEAHWLIKLLETCQAPLL